MRFNYLIYCSLISILLLNSSLIIKTKSFVKINSSKYSKHCSKGISMQFLSGLVIGLGLKIDSSNQLEECLNYNSENNLNMFIEKVKIKEDVQPKYFLKLALELFKRLNNCSVFKESVLSLIKNKLLSLTIKGIIYVVSGPIGLFVKSSYNLIKITTEIKSFVNNINSKEIDYNTLGSSVGKIIYYTQDLVFRRRRRRK